MYQIRLVCCFPLFFLALPVFISVTLFAIAWYTGNLNSGKQSLDIFLPDSMQSLKELKELLRLFPPQNALRDSYSLFGSSFAYAIFEDKSTEDGNILEAEKLKQIAQIHKMITQNIKTKNGLHFTDVCFREGANSTCTQHPIMVALEDSQANLAIKLLARYPTLRLSGGIVVDNAIIFGGVKLSPGRVDRHGNAAIERAKAIRLFYVLNQSKEADEWIRAFIQMMSKIHLNSFNLFYTSSISLPDEMERNGELLLPWMPWMVGMLLAFCAIICAKFDSIRAQPLIGLAAILNAFMAIISAISVLISIEYPFMQMILIMPFLILSIGVDNMFLMLRNWRTLHNFKGTNSNLEGMFNPDAIFVESISEVSVSIFVTSLTDGFSFAIGTLSDFMAVRVFCTYCWLAVLFMFLYQMTFLTAFMALNCRREARNRHWLFCWIQMGKDQNNSSIQQWELSNEIYKYAAQIIEHKFTKLSTLLFYLLYLYFSAIWISQLQLGLDLKLLMPDDSFAAEELRAQERLFADYGPFGYCVIFMDNKNKSGINLWERDKRRKLLEFYSKLTSGKYASKGDFWLEAFDASKHSEKLHFDGEEEFKNALVAFLQDPQFAKYQTDNRVNENGQIEAIKMAFRMRKLGHVNDQPRAEFLRSVMAKSGFRGFVYDTTFLLVDQQEVTRRNMIANILVAIGVMLLISIIFVPRPMASLSVALTILSINVGVVGALSAVKTRLDIVSMITIGYPNIMNRALANLTNFIYWAELHSQLKISFLNNVMSIGLSFDYATHVTFHFLFYRKHRIENTLRALTIPISQAALSTLVGVSALAIVPSYMVRTFVFTVIFVVSIGLAHALFFLPVLLHFVVPETEYLSSNDSSTLSIRILRELAIRSSERKSITTNSQTNSIVYFY